MCKRAKLRRSPKALVTKVIKETFWLAWLMTQGKVRSLKMMVTEMGDRGSKSDKAGLLALSVKEQRVDGSSIKFIAPSIFFWIVRCILVAGKPVLG